MYIKGSKPFQFYLVTLLFLVRVYAKKDAAGNNNGKLIIGIVNR